jgi:hypothetical protein
MRNRTRVSALVLLLSFVAASIALAEEGVSIDSWLIGGSGSARTSAGDVSVGSTLGQAVAGRSNIGLVDLQSGFWSGAGARSDQGNALYAPVILAGD